MLLTVALLKSRDRSSTNKPENETAHQSQNPPNPSPGNTNRNRIPRFGNDQEPSVSDIPLVDGVLLSESAEQEAGFGPTYKDQVRNVPPEEQLFAPARFDPNERPALVSSPPPEALASDMDQATLGPGFKDQAREVPLENQRVRAAITRPLPIAREIAPPSARRCVRRETTPSNEYEVTEI